ncbi:MAG: TIGR04222 domain-containing membrane protein [Betaproteobacteria bacterium]|nr:TIGR04222 domain-containing membrane protein [Betaproteobacteria bacterium]
MNPFELRGFSLLFFYIVLGVFTMIALRYWYKFSEPAKSEMPKFNDPYLIAYLRGGEDEAIKVAVISLTDRGLLTLDGDKLKRKYGDKDLAQREIEHAVLKACARPAEGAAVLKDAGAKRACEGYKRTLVEAGLLAGPETYAQRLAGIGAAAFVLLGTAGYKIQLALSQGRQNVGFLVFLAIIFTICLLAVWRIRRTGAGDAAVADMKQLFKRLKDRASNLKGGGQTNELAMLIGVFGLSAVTASSFPFIEKIYPVQSSNSGSGCGSSSSCGSSCGGGCGGGGCGG